LCPRCGAGLAVEPGRVSCAGCGFAAYANPSPTACALCVDSGGRLLLARRAHEPFAGRWDLPGGFVEEGEHPLDALRREIEEETGLVVEPGEFVGVWMDWYGAGAGVVSTLNLYWLARVLGGEPAAADDVTELGWFAPDELPPADEVAFANVPLVLEAWRQQHAQRPRLDPEP
jgi:ADP-ribose pyrophosphatase YjhB (NUDIX family)